MDRYKFTSQKGNLCNEDCAWVNESAGYVIDGSSGLYNVRVTPEESDAKWFSHKIGAFLQKHLDSCRPIDEILRDSCAECLKEYQMFSGDHDISFDAMPSASIAVFRRIDNNVELFVLGDCAIYVQLREKAVLSLFDQSVSLLDATVVEFMKRRAKELGISLNGIAAEASALLRKNRKKKNTPDGYWILEPYGIGIPHGDMVSLNISSLKSVALMSDGFHAAVPILYSTVYELLREMENGSLDEIALRILNALDMDQTMDKYPRLKIKDDASAVWYKI